tara:strand:- start:237 stop:677 length:441 start_codon:yes stop_codon:yes gene_type:complete
MATSFTNNWKNILDKLENVFRTEFSNALPVYTGEVNEKAGSQYLRFDPVGSDLLEYSTNSETREFSIDILLYFGDKSESRTKLDAILRLVSRVESLIHDNMVITLSDTNSTTLANNRLESTILNSEEDSEFYVVKWDFKGQHTITF